MNITFRAMTLQTSNNQPKSKLVYGFPDFKFSKQNGNFGKIKEGTQQQIIVYIRFFQKCVNEKTNYKYNSGEVYYSSCSYLIDRETLEVSIDGINFEKVNFEKSFNKEYNIIDNALL